MTDSPVSTAVVIRSGGALARPLPLFVRDAGPEAEAFTAEFFAARIPNVNTRAAYERAVRRFATWAQARGIQLARVNPVDAADYLQGLGEQLQPPSVNLHLAALRQWFDWLTQRGVFRANPIASVKGPRHSVDEGKTPVLEAAEARALFASITGTDVVSLRDQAVLSIMLFGFVRVSAVVKMRVGDFEDTRDGWLVLREKGGKDRRIPCHHVAREHLRAYLLAGALEPGGDAPLFQTAPRHTPALSGLRMSRQDVWKMVKRRCEAAGLPADICNHSFRATGITIHQQRGGDIQEAAKLAGHKNVRTTQLYNRSGREVARAEVERVQL
jgi:site-specific recombinase XerD